MARVTLRLPEDLHRRLRSTSQRSGSSLNQVIVTALDGALRQGEPGGQADSSLLDQVRLVRRALGEMAVEVDATFLQGDAPFTEDLPDTDTLRKSMPHLTPPLSSTISAEREDRL